MATHDHTRICTFGGAPLLVDLVGTASMVVP